MTILNTVNNTYCGIVLFYLL